MAWRKKYAAARVELKVTQLRNTPVIVRAAADDKFDEIFRCQTRKLIIAVARLLTRTWRLDINDQHHALINTRKRHRAARLKRDPIAVRAELLQELCAAFLRERFAARHADVTGAKLSYARKNGGQLPPITAVEGVSGVAVLAAQRTAGETHKRRRNAGSVRLPLQRIEDFREL